MRQSTRILFLISIFACWHINAFAQAPEPTAQPTTLQFNSVKTYSMVANFTATTADGYLVLKSTQPITDVPADGVTYQKGQGLATSKVLYVGANTIIPVKEMVENTTYYLAVFAYNGTGSNTNYLLTNPLTASVNTPVADPDMYYQGINPASSNFISDLHTLVNTHTMVAYTAYKSNIVPAIFERDTIGGQVAINCEYSNETTIYTPPFDFTTQEYNREHVLCKSWMKTAAIQGASNLINFAEGADYFNLLLTRSTPNQVRSNNPLGIVINTTSTYGESKYGVDNLGENVFEPKANRKGDAARALFYEMVCYDGLEGGWGLDELLSEAGEQDQNVLKLWHQQDPPDRWERTKNDYIFSLQQNRNPFIDHPEWVQCINFDSLMETNLCSQLSVNDQHQLLEPKLYPNPVYSEFTVDLPWFNNSIDIVITDLCGREVVKTKSESSTTTITTQHLSKGNYLLQLNTGNRVVRTRFVVSN